MAQRMDVRVGMDVKSYDLRSDREKDAEVTPPIGFDPNTPSRY